MSAHQHRGSVSVWRRGINIGSNKCHQRAGSVSAASMAAAAQSINKPSK